MRTPHAPALVALVALSSLGHAAVIVIDGERQARHPSLAADAKGNLHAAYEADDQDKGVSEIFYASSKDGGKTWSAAVNVSGTAGISDDPAIAIGKAGEIVIVWADTTPGEKHPDIHVTTSSDGKTWSKAAAVWSTPGVSSQPAVAVAADGAIHVVWQDTAASADAPDLWHSSSKDKGKTWSRAENITRTPGVSSDPAIACGPKGQVVVAFADTSNGKVRDIWFTESSDGGKTWAKPLDVSNTAGVSLKPDVGVDGKGAIYIAWDDATAGHPDIFVAISRDGGKTFDKGVNVSKTPGLSSDPSIAVTSDGQLAVVWVDTSLDKHAPDVWIARSGDGGKTFTAASNLSSTPGMSASPAVAIVKSDVVAIWEETEAGRTHVKLASTPLK